MGKRQNIRTGSLLPGNAIIRRGCRKSLQMRRLRMAEREEQRMKPIVEICCGSYYDAKQAALGGQSGLNKQCADAWGADADNGNPANG